MKKDLSWLSQNIKDDIDKASNSEINELYTQLNALLEKYDNDSLIKNIFDWFSKIFKSKRERCKYILNDIIEETKDPNFIRKDELRSDLLKISNIHRDFLENLASLLGSL